MSLNAIINWFKPREKVFFALLEKAAANLCEAVEYLHKELEANDPARWENLRSQMKVFEHIGDDINREIIDRLDQTFVTPIDRDDILNLSHALDDVVDSLDNVSERLALYGVGQVRPPILEMTKLLIEGASQLVFLTRSLKNMKNVKEIRNSIRLVKNMEDQADDVYSSYMGNLFATATAADAIELIKWKQIIENLEEASDAVELVAKLIASTVTKNA
jgi:predicted phosphate transport protein (TIGR00153 family)